MQFFPGARPLNDDLAFADRAQIFVGPYGADYEENVGNFDSLSMAWDVQERELIANDSSVAFVSKREVYRFGGTLTAALKHKTEFTKDVLFASDPDADDLEQGVVAAGTKEIVDAKKGRLYSLGALRVEDVVVTGPAAAVLVENVDYFVDYDTGHIQALKDFATFDVEFTAPAVTTRKRAIGAKPTKYYSVRIRQINAQGDDIVFPKCMIRVDGNFDFAGDGSQFGAVSVSIAIQLDPTQPPGFELGYAIPVGAAIPAML